MTHRMALAVIACCAVFLYPVQAQKPSTDGCPITFGQDDSQPGRFHVTWVKDSHGEARAVKVPVKELRVARLNFAGQTALPEFLQEEIATSLISRSYDDDREGLNEFQSRIVDAWQQQGYFRARADLSNTQVTDESADTRTVAVTVTIQAGKQYQLDEIRFKDLSAGQGGGSTAVTEGAKLSAAELRSLFLIQQGDIFDTHKIHRGLEMLRQAYGTKGFVNMTVVPSTQIDEKTNRITATLEIDEGRQFHIGEIHVVGFDAPTINIALNNLGLVPSAVFDTSQLGRLNDDIRTAAPSRFNVEDDLQRHFHEDRGTVDLTLTIHSCATP